MKQFSLEKYLENPSRKVVTRRGNPVRILCTDRKHGEDDLPIVFLEECSNGGEFLLTCKSDGTADYPYATLYDLFFADEEEELTEFEKKLKEVLYEHATTNTSSEEKARQYAPELLDLARKEVLKDLPKWKKANKETDFEESVLIYEDDYICYDDHVYIDDYYIERNELKKLPKAE